MDKRASTINSFNFEEFIKKYEIKIGRKLNNAELEKAKIIYQDLVFEREQKERGLYFSKPDKNSEQILRSKVKESVDPEVRRQNNYKNMEDYMLKDAEVEMERDKKRKSNETLEVQSDKRINLKWPGNVKIIAKDNSGEVIEINNQEDVNLNFMRFRYDILKDMAKEVAEESIHNEREFN